MPKVTHDTTGRPYAKLSKCKVGTMLECDGGFDCNKHGARRRVLSHPNGLYIRCKSDKHFLSGQADDGEHLIGLYCV